MKCSIRILSSILFTLAIASTAIASDPYKRGSAALSSGDAERALAEFETALRSCKNCPQYVNSKADALFILGHRDEATLLYAETLRESLKSAYDDTKSKGKVMRGIGFAAMLLGGYVDHQNAASGIVSNEMMNMTEATASIKVTEAVGDKDYREIAKVAVSDLRTVARNAQSGLIVVNPNHNFLPGATMARVLLNGGQICNAVRVAQYKYLTSRQCLADRSATSLRQQWNIVVQTNGGLRPTDSVPAISIDDSKDEMVITVEANDTDVSKNTWSVLKGDPDASGVLEYGVTWFDQNFGYTVPRFESCGTSLAGCPAEAKGEYAVTWASTGAGWAAIGFTNPN